MDCIAENLKNCNCTYMSCDKRGACCKCIAYHKDKDQLPACYFDAETEKTYDRSVENYLRMRNK